MAVVVLWGPPCSGKSTYIRERARGGDAVIDFDRIARAFSVEGTPAHQAPKLPRELAYRARRAAVRSVTDLAPANAGTTVWVIDSGATQAQLEEWRARGAAVVVLDVDLDTCLERAEEDGRPPSYAREISRWFARYAPPDVEAVEAAAPTPVGRPSRRW